MSLEYTVAGLNILVRQVDDEIGEIRDSVDDAGLVDNTLVIYTTENGIAFLGAKITLLDYGDLPLPEDGNLLGRRFLHLLLGQSGYECDDVW